MKASIAIADTIGVIGVIGIVIFSLTQILPSLLDLIIQTFSKASAENVARQLSNLITVSGAGTHEVEINYMPLKSALYDVSIVSRTIKVVPKFTASYAEKASSTQKFAVGLSDRAFYEANSFLIKKGFSNGESTYEFNAEKK